MLRRRARSRRLGVGQLGSRSHSRAATLAHARLRPPAGSGAATVRPGQRCHALSRVCRLTLQSRGRAPASRVTPLISNVRLHSCRKRSTAGAVEWMSRCSRKLSGKQCRHLWQMPLLRSSSTEKRMGARYWKQEPKVSGSRHLSRTSRSPASRKPARMHSFIIGSASMVRLAMLVGSR